jgi:hypothetical protein
MAIGRNSRGMHIGIFQGSSIVYTSYDEECLNKSCTSNTYLIENPTEQELIIKEKVQRLLLEEENERKRKASLKTIPLKELVVGGIYETVQGDMYMYLGKRKVVFEDFRKKTNKEEYGNCFAYLYSIKNKADDEILENLLDIRTYNLYNSTHNIDILKGNKKLIKMIKKVDLKFPIEKTKESNSRWSNEKYKLTIT